MKIPQLFFKDSNNGDVMDSFLSHFTLEISKYFSNLIKTITQTDQVHNKKDTTALQALILSELSTFPAINTIINAGITTFASISRPNINKAITKLNEFFPSIIGVPKSTEMSSENVLSFFPDADSENSELAITVNFISEATYATLLLAILEDPTKIQDSILESIINRLLVRQSAPAPGTFSFKVIRLINNLNKPIITAISKTNFLLFSTRFNSIFPKTTTGQNVVINFLHSAIGINFDAENYNLIEPSIVQLQNLIKTFKSSDDFINAACVFLYDILSQNTNIKEKDLSYFTKFAEKHILSPVSWANAERLYGVCHYLRFPDLQNKQYQEFYQQKVVKRLVKIHKADTALQYIIAFLRPSEFVKLNLDNRVFDIIGSIFQTVFTVNLSHHEENASILLEILAALDIHKFTNEWIPTLLNPTSPNINVALRTIGRILNPLSGFFNLSGTSPRSTNKSSKVYINVLIERIKSLSVQWFSDRPRTFASNAFDFVSADEILSSIDVKPSYGDLNYLTIPSNVLMFLLNPKNFTSVRRSPRGRIEDRASAEASTKDALTQWSNVFETPIEYFGSFYSVFHLPMIETLPVSSYTRSEVLYLKFMPIVIYYSNSIDEYVNYIIDLILSDIPEISSCASITFEMLFFALPSSAELFITALSQAITLISDKSCVGIHQLILTFLHCIQSSGNIFKSNASTILYMCDLVSLIALCSPFPETRQIGLEIVDSSEMLLNFIIETGGKGESCLFAFLQDNYAQIEQQIMITVISSFSSINAENCPIHRIPSIPLRSAALSPYLILWKFSLKEIETQMIYHNMTPNILFIRRALLSSFEFINTTNGALDYLNNENAAELHHFSNLFGFLLSTADTMPSISDMFQRKKWSEQISLIENYFNTLMSCAMTMKAKALPAIFFLCITAHIVMLPNIFDLLFKALRNDDLKNSRKDFVLILFSIVLRNFAVSCHFSEYIGKLMNTGTVSNIFKLFDQQLEILWNSDGTSHYVQLFQCIEHLTNFLVFRGQYFKYLHQTTLLAPHGPIPRCAISTITNSKLISPIMDKSKMFDLLFKWSLLGLNCDISPDVNEALKTTKLDANTLKVFGHITRIALSYLVSLTPLFKDSSTMNLSFINKCTMIANERPSFIKHLLTHHYDIFIDNYCEIAMSSTLDSASRFMGAISNQFVAPSMKDSMIYTHDTFIKNMSTAVKTDLDDNEKGFIELIYSKTGKILLVGLFFLLHSDIKIRQQAIRMIGQVSSVLCMIHYNCDFTVAKNLMNNISKQIENLPTNINSTRMDNCVELSTVCSKLFCYCTEQLLKLAFSVLPKISVNRKECTRSQLITLICPWILNIDFDYRKRIVIKNPISHFIIYSPSTFITDLIECLCPISDPNVPLMSCDLILWRNLAQPRNFNFLVTSLVDYGTFNPDSRSFLESVITYLYRIDPETTSNCVVPLLAFGNWYFQHLQLGRFEEIHDMTVFLKDIDKDPKKRQNIDTTRAIENYIDSTEFAITLICNLAKEDIIPLTFHFNTILSFCLTHIEQTSTFNLMFTIVDTLRNSFNNGIPECLLNLNELFSHIMSSDLNTLHFICERTSSPLRALQEHYVSLTDILDMFNNVFTYMPADQENSIQDLFLLWGVSCGNLITASTALNIFSILFESVDFRALSLIIESICIVTRCCLSATHSDNGTASCCMYISSALKALNSISRSLIASKKITGLSEIFQTAISLLNVSGIILQNIVVDNLKLLMTLIDSGDISLFALDKDIRQDLKDTKDIFIDVIKTCKDSSIIFKFAVKVLKLPCDILSKNQDFSVYLIPLLPLFWLSVASPDMITHLCPISEFYECTQILMGLIANQHITKMINSALSGKSDTPHVFSNELMQVLSQSFGDSFFKLCAEVLTFFIPLADAISMNSIFDLATAILAYCPTKDVFRALLPLTRQATLNQSCGNNTYQMPYLKSALSSGNAEQLDFLLRGTPSSELITMNSKDTSFVLIQQHVNLRLHTNYGTGSEIFRVKFDTIDSFPPIFPFVQSLLQTNATEEVANFCRRIEVDPYTKWSEAIYNAFDISDEKSPDSEKIHLDLNAEFISKVSSTLEEVLQDNNQSSTASKLVPEQEEVEIHEEEESEKENEEIYQNYDKIDFLPTMESINNIVSEFLLQKGVADEITFDLY
ncbi:hypothetical protein TVAG_096790 [Trichomonas vaginalis G3]|uniref:Uncharacterized protein n=1 Tax=Trichomonas vaginalis (strain ATCC PRA-98 / G3) TaxID=412133 RepID=A2F2X5_TRIV3|nr:hypothetical protein TVAGG3_0342250 [Trichomonas vaginalis G3]EAY00768.1 hypothetical protein TVAG_096790 [Trichomonas vaginalis G3]KAI5530728.1 hypothetical protein TVAGG3_0342250 [Trichomonas vaginalis G3]|eukprot:XP_001313697.1 hypothetical protein [Trichomonas vaginalis G3]